MTPFIPFINSVNDLHILNDFYGDIQIVRISLENRGIISTFKKSKKIWLDPAIDALHSGPPNDLTLATYFKRINGYKDIIDYINKGKFLNSPDKDVIKKFVYGILGKCKQYNPAWLSIPQLPIDKNNKSNKFNKISSNVTLAWAKENNFRGKLILPVILSHQELSTKKVKRDRIIKYMINRIEKYDIGGLWVVDKGLNDLSGSDTLGKPKLPGLIKFHNELKENLPSSVDIIAGPYWGLNLILWAQGLATYAAIGLGRGYRYYYAGGKGHLRRGSAKVAVDSLKRLVTFNSQLKSWLINAKNDLLNDAKAKAEVNSLLHNFDKYSDPDLCREQISLFYKKWIDALKATPPAGRSLALYQDFSDAFVTGKSITKPLPSSESVARRAEQVAKQFMLNCL